MKYLIEGEQIEVKGSGKNPYIVKKSGGVVSCSCPAWRNLGGPIDNRVCKHIKANIDPECLLPQAQQKIAVNGGEVLPTPVTVVQAATASAPPCILAHSYVAEDPVGMWMSEKLDGVRAWWDGEKFISRLGNVYHAPEFYKQMMPKGIVLDGELWNGRGQFQTTVSVVRKLVPNESEWRQVKFFVFDAPEVDKPFEQRMEYLDALLEAHDGPFCWDILPQVQCKSHKHMEELLEQMISNGAEGLMLRAPKSKYEAGRSHTLLKVKRFYDAEAMVVGHEPGKGKHKGRMGAIKCQMVNGNTFSIGSGFTDKEREHPPSIGTFVTYRYQELTNDGIPRFPTFVSARDYE